MISVRIAGGVFVPRWLPTLSTFLMCLLLLGLGTWQVERLHWKENLLQTIHERMAEAPVDVSALNIVGSAKELEERLDYRQVHATGHYVGPHNFYVIAISVDGEGGYDIISPFMTSNNQIILINRGWIPYDLKQKDDGSTHSPPSGNVTLDGTIRIPRHHWLQPEDRPDQNEWYGIDLVAMGERLSLLSLMPFVIVEKSDGSSSYPRGGQVLVDLPNNHFTYALTWYGLAIVLLMIYGLQGWTRTPRS